MAANGENISTTTAKGLSVTPQNISLQVNGEWISIEAEPRTMLADLLRDHLRLTGTHLGCEQGVCGACTILINGKPMRSCLSYVSHCDGSSVDTIESFNNDPLMSELRDAFSQQHGLQCGFCTSGMLIMARDMVQRIRPLDQQRIRLELGGNLCRCTGYMGIVEAIRHVSSRYHPQDVEVLVNDAKQSKKHQARSFTQFTIASEYICNGTVNTSGSEVDGTHDEFEGWTTVVRSFELVHSRDKVWELFKDLHAVSKCIPGLTMTDVSGEKFSCNMQIKFGPISANFTGGGQYENGPGDFESHLEGAGGDQSGQTSTRAVVTYRISEGITAERATIQVILRYQLDGPLAQFNRQDLTESFIEILLQNFMSNANLLLSGKELQNTDSLSTFSLLKDFMRLQWNKLVKRVRSWFAWVKPKA